jgi:eukaryotic-like serine/threonine-protein kinase
MAGGEIAAGAVLGAERYTLTRRLGAGGMAAVWLAADEVLARPVAVKVIADTLAHDERYRERFAREARTAASVSHPGIVPVYDYGLHGGRPFLVMEYVPGGSLADLLGRRTAELPEPRELARELLGALACVHGAGLVHRDVKPGNILLDAEGRARLTDFGIAQPEDAASLTATGMVIGSMRYLAPEVADGARATVSADLFAAGVVLRELTDRRPAPGLAALVAALTRGAPAGRPASAAAALELIGAVSPGPGRPLVPRPPGADAPGAPTLIAPALAPAVPPPEDRPTVRAARPAPAEGRGRVRPAFRRPPRALALAAAVAVIAIVGAILLASGGGGGGAGRSGGGGPAAAGTAAAGTAGSSAAPAAASAPLSQQLDALEQIVARAAQR